MLAPLAETHSPAFARLAKRSRDLWPEFARELEAETGKDIDFDATGSLLIASQEDELQFAAWQQTARELDETLHVLDKRGAPQALDSALADDMTLVAHAMGGLPRQ